MKKSILFIVFMAISSFALKEYYRHFYLFDGELIPDAVTLSGEVDVNTPENFRVRIGGSPLVVYDNQDNVSISIGAGYRYIGLADLSGTDYTPNRLQNINYNFFGTGDFRNNVWWIGYIQYKWSADTLFNSNVFNNSTVSYLATVGYKPNDRFTFGLALVGTAGKDIESMLHPLPFIPIPVIRAALVPQKLWVWLGPLPETGIKWRPTKRFFTTAGFKLGGDEWYTSVLKQKELFSQSVNNFWLGANFKIKGLVWAFSEVDFPVSNTYDYRDTEYPQNGTVIIRAGIRVAVDSKGFTL